MKRGSVFAFALIVIAAGGVLRAQDSPSEPLTTTKLSVLLARQCAALSQSQPAVAAIDCTPADAPASPAEVDRCRTTLVDTTVTALRDQLDSQLSAHAETILHGVEGDSRVVQRLHPVLALRRASLLREAEMAVRNRWKGLSIAAGGSGTLATRAVAAATADLSSLKAAVDSAVLAACTVNDASVLQAIFPRLLTPEEAAASSELEARQKVDEHERRAFEEFSRTEGFVRSVRCLWAVGADSKPKLACNPGLLVSGEQVSEIRIYGLPSERLDVTVMSSESFKANGPCSANEDLTCHSASFDQLSPYPLIIAVHTQRWFSPSWGTHWGFSLDDAKQILRKNISGKLAIVTNGTIPSLSVRVRSAAGEATEAVAIGYARWKIESGGFTAISDLVDDEVVVEGTGAGAKVKAIRRSDNIAQDSGIFVNFVPQNYQDVGVSLGFATPPNRRPAIYVGPSIRVRTFGDRGLASLSGGWTMRSVLRFPDLKETDPVDTAAAAYRGKEQYEFGWYVGLNLGFKFGSFGGDGGGQAQH